MKRLAGYLFASGVRLLQRPASRCADFAFLLPTMDRQLISILEQDKLKVDTVLQVDDARPKHDMTYSRFELVLKRKP